MIKGIYQSSQKLNANMKNMSIIANNLANINTTGFKRKIPFSEILESRMASESKKVTDFQQGELNATANPFDLAIRGDAFFVVETEEGYRFTKNGHFKLTDEGYLVTQNNEHVVGKGGEINLKNAILSQDSNITINRKGEIKVGNVLVDRLQIAKFEDKQDLKNVGDSNFEVKEDEYDQANAQDFEVYQGYLEGSNVNALTEMESMIQISKDYESAHRMVNYLDQSLAKANEIGNV